MDKPHLTPVRISCADTGGAALWGESTTSEFRLFTFWDLNKISNDRKSKRLSSSDFRTSSQSIRHSEINISQSTLTQNLEEWDYENVHKMLNTGGK